MEKNFKKDVYIFSREEFIKRRQGDDIMARIFGEKGKYEK